MASAGYFFWPGIQNGYLSATFTMTHGITPSVCVIYIIPQDLPPAISGTLVISYDGDGVELPDCRLDFISVDVDEQGREVWGLHILDRRWRWRKCGAISGIYNIRASEGDAEPKVWSLIQPQSFASLCLEAMGEFGFDVGALPNDSRPEIEADYDNAADQLAKLCDDLGCRVVLDPRTNRVVLCKSGDGEQLPNGPALNGDFTFDPPEMPDTLVAAMGKTVVQYDLTIKAVVQESDGTIKPIDDSSFKPTTPGGWNDIDPPAFLNIADPTKRELAKKSLFRWYRIDFGDGLTLAAIEGDDGTLTDLRQILPILDKQITKSKGDGDENPPEALNAWVYGIWYDKKEIGANVTDSVDSTVQAEQTDKGFYGGDFEIDKARGIVKFGEPVYRLSTDGNGTVLPADLRLRTSFNIRSQETHAWLRYTKELETPGEKFGTMPYVKKFDDVALQLNYTNDSNTSQFDNTADLNQAADLALSTMLAEFDAKDPSTKHYIGFIFPSLDGAIQQITWNDDEQGKMTTTVSRNREDLVVGPSYKEQRETQKLQAALADAGRVSRVKQQSLSQNSPS